MRLPRAYTTEPLVPGGELELDARTSTHLCRVLRLRAGDTVVLFNGDGWDYVGELIRASREAAVIQVREQCPAVPESPLRVTLVQAISRGERMDHTLQKCTELGASAFRPVFTERVEVRLDAERAARRMHHWQGVIRSACEQCGRTVLPILHPPVELWTWLAAEPDGQRLMLDADAAQALSMLDAPATGLELLVGPEGGLSPAERERLAAHRVQAVGLGPRTLRTETAGAAALAVLQARHGDL